MLELAVQMSVQTHDQAAFERNNQQLRQHYMESRQVLPPSQNEAVLTGLNLLRLLVQNRIAEFHTELEVIPSEVWSIMTRTLPADRALPEYSCFAGQ
jgi:26S proteasome regulatory subunit N12